VLEQPEGTDDYARATISHALRSRPEEVWTPQALASRYGISVALAHHVLGELSAAGVVLRLEGPDDEYTAA
jgi:ribosomal protein S25